MFFQHLFVFLIYKGIEYLKWKWQVSLWNLIYYAGNFLIWREECRGFLFWLWGGKREIFNEFLIEIPFSK